MSSYFKFLPEHTLAVHVLDLFPMSFVNPDRLNKLLAASVFVQTGCRNCSASTTGFSSSLVISILSPTNRKPTSSVISLKSAERPSVALSFILFLTFIFSCSDFGSTDVLWIRVFKSIIKLNSTFFNFSPASAFFVFLVLFLDMVDLIVMYRLSGEIIVFQANNGKICRWFHYVALIGAPYSFGFVFFSLRARTCSRFVEFEVVSTPNDSFSYFWTVVASWLLAPCLVLFCSFFWRSTFFGSGCCRFRTEGFQVLQCPAVFLSTVKIRDFSHCCD